MYDNFGIIFDFKKNGFWFFETFLNAINNNFHSFTIVSSASENIDDSACESKDCELRMEILHETI